MWGFPQNKPGAFKKCIPLLKSQATLALSNLTPMGPRRSDSLKYLTTTHRPPKTPPWDEPKLPPQRTDRPGAIDGIYRGKFRWGQLPTQATRLVAMDQDW